MDVEIEGEKIESSENCDAEDYTKVSTESESTDKAS